MINLEINERIGGMSAYFEHNGSRYYADVAQLPYIGEFEFAIFPVVFGNIDFSEVAMYRVDEVSAEVLTQGVERFIAEN